MRLLLIALAAVSASLPSCASVPRAATLPPDGEAFRSAQRFEQVYVVLPGDQLEISVENLPELSRTVTVRPDGMVSLQKVGDVTVAGLGVAEAREAIRSKFSERLVAPVVSLAIANPREETAFVMGEVGRPSAVPLRNARTVAQALALAGGPTRAASLKGVALIRLDGNGHLAATIINDGQPGAAAPYLRMQATPLRAGDIILVPESGRSRFVRFVQDFVSTPLGGLNQLLSPYLQLRVLREVQ